MNSEPTLDLESRVSALEKDISNLKYKGDPRGLISEIVDLITMESDEIMIESLQVINRFVNPGLDK